MWAHGINSPSLSTLSVSLSPSLPLSLPPSLPPSLTLSLSRSLSISSLFNPQQVQEDPNAYVPYGVEAAAAGQSWTGGKLDDTCALVLQFQ